MTPKTLYANVLLLDGKIINHKTGTFSWAGDRFWMSKQPNIVADKEDRLEVKQLKCVVTTVDDNNTFFSETSKSFFRQFEIHPEFPENCYLPYE